MIDHSSPPGATLTRKASEKFRIGDRVRLSPLGMERFANRTEVKKGPHGVVVGLIDHSVKVRREGVVTPCRYHMDFWEKDE